MSRDNFKSHFTLKAVEALVEGNFIEANKLLSQLMEYERSTGNRYVVNQIGSILNGDRFQAAIFLASGNRTRREVLKEMASIAPEVKDAD